MKIIRNCETCNSKFEVTQHRVNEGNGKFCSRKCFQLSRPTVMERFWEKVNKTDACWLWKGSLSKDGYATIDHIPIHRFSYILHHGEIEIGMLICHKCDTRHCVNPEHLFVGTHQDNATDRKNKNRSAKGVNNGRHTHPEKTAIGINNGRSKLHERDIINIRQMASKMSNRKIAKLYNVSNCTINQVINLKRWRHVV